MTKEEKINIIIAMLKLIKKQDQKIKQLNKGQQSLMKSRKKWKNRYYKMKAENKELNKIIDLMAEQLTTPIHNKEWIKQYYENKAKEN